MSLPLIEVLKIVAPVVGGGLAGAGLTWFVSWWRNRIQPISVQKVILPFMNREICQSTSQVEILLNSNGEKSSFTHLTLGRVTLRNTGNKDYEEFKFGITIPGLSMAVSVQTEGQDRNHEITSSPQIDLNHLHNEINFTLQPFNRKDTYSIVIFISPIDNQPIELNLSTKHPIRFVNFGDYRALASDLLDAFMVQFAYLPEDATRKLLKP